MKITLNEDQMANLIFEESIESKYGKDYADKLKQDKNAIWDLLDGSGNYMISNDNDKLYRVYYLAGLSQYLGRDYAICRLVHLDDFTDYGSTYIKPFALFRKYNQDEYKNILNKQKSEEYKRQQKKLNSF